MGVLLSAADWRRLQQNACSSMQICCSEYKVFPTLFALQVLTKYILVLNIWSTLLCIMFTIKVGLLTDFDILCTNIHVVHGSLTLMLLHVFTATRMAIALTLLPILLPQSQVAVTGIQGRKRSLLLLRLYHTSSTFKRYHTQINTCIVITFLIRHVLSTCNIQIRLMPLSLNSHVKVLFVYLTAIRDLLQFIFSPRNIAQVYM